MATRWRTGEVVAWTEHDGPGLPPHASKAWAWIATAATLGIAFSGIIMTDALCPEHRVWVQTLATLAFIGIVLSIVGLLRSWASGPAITAVSAGLGAAIGLIDAVHAPLRGGLIAGGFALVVLVSAWLAAHQFSMRQWDRRVKAELQPTAQVPVAMRPASETTASVAKPSETTAAADGSDGKSDVEEEVRLTK